MFNLILNFMKTFLKNQWNYFLEQNLPMKLVMAFVALGIVLAIIFFIGTIILCIGYGIAGAPD